MITIIHGSDTAASRRFFLDEKFRLNGVLMRDDEVNMTSLAQVLDGGGLFEEAKHLFIEQFLTNKKKSAEKDAIISFLVKQGKMHSIVLWEGRELVTSALSPFKGGVIKPFKLPFSLFTFLDNFRPGNGAQLVKLFHETLVNTEPEMVFFMLIRQLRILLCLSEKSEGTITEVSRLSPWQKGKLEKQVKLFEKEQLKHMYAKLFAIETGQKTGTLNSPLASTLDFFLLDLDNI